MCICVCRSHTAEEDSVGQGYELHGYCCEFGSACRGGLYVRRGGLYVEEVFM